VTLLERPSLSSKPDGSAAGREVQVMRKPRLLVQIALAFYWLLMSTPILLYASQNTLWQIGQFDQSSEEFGSSFSIIPIGLPPDPIFDVSKNDWKKDWAGFHPGSSNGQARGRKHPFTIVFNLDHPPLGTYTLTLSTLHYMPQRPNIEIEINGHRSLYYFRPRISYNPSEFPVAFIPQFGSQRLEIDFPATSFQKGENRLVLTAIDDNAETSQAIGTAATGISGFHYDAVKLTEDKDKAFAPKGIQATVLPTVFYKQKGEELAELVEVIIRLNQKITKGLVSLELNGNRYTAKLPLTSEIGEQRFVFEIPGWTGKQTAGLKVEAGTTRNFEMSVEPQRKWRVFVAPHTHLDVGYTDYQGKVAELQARVLLQAMDLLKKNPGFRFSIDGSWVLEQLLTTRPEAAQKEILQLLKEGKMSLPAQYLNLLTGIASLETLYRSLYYSKSLARQHQFPMDYANITDVPSHTGSYPSVLASSGIKYFTAGGNNWRAPFLLGGLWNEKSPFWWEGPDGKKVLFWYSRHYMQVQSLFGLPPQQAAIRDSLPVFLQAYSTDLYKPDSVLVFGTQVENTDLYPETATFIEAWNREYASR